MKLCGGSLAYSSIIGYIQNTQNEFYDLHAFSFWTRYSYIKCLQHIMHLLFYSHSRCAKVTLTAKHLQLVQRKEKLLFWCAQVTREDWTGSFENFNSDLRNVPKRLRKTVVHWCKRFPDYSSYFCHLVVKEKMSVSRYSFSLLIMSWYCMIET